MSEYIRKSKFKIYIDTNKRTIEEEFETVEDLIDFLDSLDDFTFGHLKYCGD